MFDSLLQLKGFESHDTGYYCGLWRDAQKLNLSNQTVSKDKSNQTFTYTTSTMGLGFFFPVFIISQGDSIFILILISCFAATKYIRYVRFV